MEDELLFETPNGSVITESEAKSKYGDRFQSLLDSGTFKQTDKTADKKEEVKIDFDVEAFYISPNGSEIKGADVVKKYGNRSQSLVDDGTLKKKRPVCRFHWGRGKYGWHYTNSRNTRYLIGIWMSTK